MWELVASVAWALPGLAGGGGCDQHGVEAAGRGGGEGHVLWPVNCRLPAWYAKHANDSALSLSIRDEEAHYRPPRPAKPNAMQRHAWAWAHRPGQAADPPRPAQLNFSPLRRLA